MRVSILGIHSVYKMLCDIISIYTFLLILSFMNRIYLFTMNVKIKKKLKYLNTSKFFKTVIIKGT